MFGVVVGDGGPFEGYAQIPLDPIHQIARQAGEINPVTELRRGDDLPKPLIPRCLPGFDPSADVNAFSSAVETCRSGFSGRPLAREITAMGAPLTADSVPGIRDADRAPLAFRYRRLSRTATAGT